MDFTVLADHRVKIKENKKIDKYMDLAKEQTNKQTNKKQPWNMRVMVAKGLEKRLKELEIRERTRERERERERGREKSPGNLMRLAVTQKQKGV